MLERLGRFNEALPHCVTAIGLAAESEPVGALVQHGRLLLATGAPEEAIAAFERAAGAAPLSPEPHHGVAEAARAAGEYSRMRDALIAMAQLNAADASPEFQLWYSLWSDRIEALEAQARALGDSAQLRYGVAMAQLDLGRWQEAIRELGNAAGQSDAPADAVFWLGVNDWLNGDRDGARARYDRALALAPNHAAALRALERLSGP
jgi:tetratricopeptide (TPR) repeat protein